MRSKCANATKLSRLVVLHLSAGHSAAERLEQTVHSAVRGVYWTPESDQSNAIKLSIINASADISTKCNGFIRSLRCPESWSERKSSKSNLRGYAIVNVHSAIWSDSYVSHISQHSIYTIRNVLESLEGSWTINRIEVFLSTNNAHHKMCRRRQTLIATTKSTMTGPSNARAKVIHHHTHTATLRAETPKSETKQREWRARKKNETKKIGSQHELLIK